MAVSHLIRALSRISVKGINADQNAGIALALRALEGPIRQIAANAGDEPSIVVEKSAFSRR